MIILNDRLKGKCFFYIFIRLLTLSTNCFILNQEMGKTNLTSKKIIVLEVCFCYNKLNNLKRKRLNMRYSNQVRKDTEMKSIPFRDLLAIEEKEANFFSSNETGREKTTNIFIDISLTNHSFSSLFPKSRKGEEIKELTEAFFVNNFFKIIADKSWCFRDIVVKKDCHYNSKNDKFNAECKEVDRKRYVAKMHEEFLKISNRLINYHYKGSDPFFSFKYKTDKSEFSKLFVLFKNNILNKYHNYDEFYKVFRPLLDKKIDDFFNKELFDLDLLSTKEIYTISKKETLEKVIETGRMPNIEYFKYINLEITSNGSVSLFFAKYDNGIRIKTDGWTPNDLIRVDLNNSGVNIYQEKEEHMIFINEKEAKSFYKDRLHEMRNKIDKALSTTYEF